MTIKNCAIYKGQKKIDSYLFVENEDDFSRVPQSLLDMIGKLEFVMTLELTADRKLARGTASDVMQHLDSNGYYLQLPPNDVIKKNVSANLELGD